MFRLSQLTRNFDAALRDVVNENAAVRASAARDLGHQSDEDRDKAIRALEAALTDKDASVRSTAAEALGDLHAVDALDALLTAVEDSDPGVRQQAICALGELRDPRAADRLERALGDLRPEVRFQAVMAFPRVTSSRKDALSALVDATADRDPYVAHIAFRMAEELADEMGGGLDSRLVDRAVQSLDHASPRVRAVAAVVATSAEDERGHATLVSVIDGSIVTPESEDLTAAIELAGERKIAAAVPALERRAFGGLLGFGRDPFAWHARTALARMGHARASEEILRDLGSLSHHKRTLAVAAAGRARLAPARGRIWAMKGDAKRAAPSAVDSALAMLDEPVKTAAPLGATE
jgi:HEAT repeat protein